MACCWRSHSLNLKLKNNILKKLDHPGPQTTNKIAWQQYIHGSKSLMCFVALHYSAMANDFPFHFTEHTHYIQHKQPHPFIVQQIVQQSLML